MRVGKRGADAAVVGDVAVLGLRDVEIDADQHLLALDVEVANRLFRHRSTPASWRKITGGPG